jgi:hypothetical protein
MNDNDGGEEKASRITDGDSKITDYRRHLQSRLRALAVELPLLDAEQARLSRELDSLKNELDRLKQAPLLFAKLFKVLGDGRIVVTDGVFMYIVHASSGIPKDELRPGTFVGLNQRTYAAVEILPGGEEEGLIRDQIPVALLGAKPIRNLSESAKLGQMSRSDTIRDFLQNSLRDNLRSLIARERPSLPTKDVVVATSEGEIVSYIGNWHPDRDDVKKVITAWRNGSATTVTLQGDDFHVLQATSDRLLATNPKNEGHILGMTITGGLRVIAYVIPDDARRNHESYEDYIRRILDG